MSQGDSQRRAELADYARRLHARGWVANHDGNLSLRLGGGRFLVTPTATSKAAVKPDSLLVVDETGARVSGSGKPVSEMSLHLAVFGARPDVSAVAHAHPPTATGFAVAGVELAEPFLAEAVVSLGWGVPTVPFALPGAAAVAALEPFVLSHDAVLLANHGVLAWGDSIEQAYLRLELVEHLAQIALVARQLGGIRPLPASALPTLLEARAKAGLARPAPQFAATQQMQYSAATQQTPHFAATQQKLPAAPSSGKPVVVACAPPPPGADVEVYQPPRSAQPRNSAVPAPADLAAIIRQEIARALRSK